jgi:anthranilate phosphoribosyltransferase
MQTLRAPKYQVEKRLLEYLAIPVEQITLALIEDAVDYLRSTLDDSVKDATAELGHNAIDPAGTGGSGLQKFNTSTTVAFLLAAHGVRVVKFGNRSITGKNGSVDFLAAIGLPANSSFERLAENLSKTDLLFINAADCYPQVGLIREQRTQLGRPSIFNYIGPLLNPVAPAFRLLGVSDNVIRQHVNQFLTRDRTILKAITVTHESGLDEFVPRGKNYGNLIDSSSLLELETDYFAKRFPGVPKHRLKKTGQSSVHQNIETFREIITGNDTRSEAYTGLIVNAAAAFLAAGASKSLEEGCELARAIVSKGSLQKKYEQIRSAR